MVVRLPCFRRIRDEKRLLLLLVKVSRISNIVAEAIYHLPYSRRTIVAAWLLNMDFINKLSVGTHKQSSYYQTRMTVWEWRSGAGRYRLYQCGDLANAVLHAWIQPKIKILLYPPWTNRGLWLSNDVTMQILLFEVAHSTTSTGSDRSVTRRYQIASLAQ